MTDVTIVMDVESGAVVHVGEGKGGDALKPFWKRLRASGAKIEAMAIAYYGSSGKNCNMRSGNQPSAISTPLLGDFRADG